MSAEILHDGNSNLIRVPQLTDHDGTVITDATVEVTITDASGTNVTGQTWPMGLPHVSAGKYEAAAPYGIGLRVGRKYTVTVTAVKDSLKAEWVFEAEAQKRTP